MQREKLRKMPMEGCCLCIWWYFWNCCNQQGQHLGRKAECQEGENMNKLESMKSNWNWWKQIRIYKDKLHSMFVPITSVLNNIGNVKNELMSLLWSYIRAWIMTWRSWKWRSSGHWRVVWPPPAPCQLGDPLLLSKFCANYFCGKLKSKTTQGSSLTMLTQ